MPEERTYRTEEEIVEGLRDRSAGAFEALFERFADLVYGFGHKVTGDEEAAREILLTTLVNTSRSAGKIKNAKAIERWLLREASNAFLAMRTRGGEPGDGEMPPEDLLPEMEGGGNPPLHDWSLDPGEEGRRSDEKKYLRETVTRLPPLHALVLVLHDMEEMSPLEISDIVQKSVNSVKTRLHQARLFLRSEISRWLHAGERGDGARTP